MTPVIAIALTGIGLTFLGGVVTFMTLMYKIGRWQSKAEGRGYIMAERRDGVKEDVKGISDRLDRMNGSITDAHRRIDALSNRPAN